MKKNAFFTLFLILVTISVLAKEYTSFNIVFEEKEGSKVKDTAIRIFASEKDDTLSDRTDEFTMEDVTWFKYLPAPAEGKNENDYDYVDKGLNIYGILVTDDDVFEHDKYSYFLRIPRLYAQKEDTFHRNVKLNGVDVDEMNATCYNAGNEFFLKSITNGGIGASGESDSEELTADASGSGSTNSVNQTKHKCKVCGICPIQPLGICLFIWIAMIVAIVLPAIRKACKNSRN